MVRASESQSASQSCMRAPPPAGGGVSCSRSTAASARPRKALRPPDNRGNRAGRHAWHQGGRAAAEGGNARQGSTCAQGRANHHLHHRAATKERVAENPRLVAATGRRRERWTGSPGAGSGYSGGEICCTGGTTVVEGHPENKSVCSCLSALLAVDSHLVYNPKSDS